MQTVSHLLLSFAASASISHHQRQRNAVRRIEDIITCLSEQLVQFEGKGAITINLGGDISFVGDGRGRPRLV